MRVLVSGADGFVGNHLLNELIARRHDVIAGFFKDKPQAVCQHVKIDITNPLMLEDAIDRYQPEGIVHLAAQSSVKHSWEKPADTVRVNTVGTIVLLETVAKMSSKTKVIYVGSGEEYGLSALKGKPLTELDPCFPQNPYAVSKLAAGLISLQIARKENLNVIYARPFNHFGPGQPKGFIVSDIASQIARIERGLMDNVIQVGDLGAERDFTDVRDIVRAYVMLLEKEVETGIYNICSGVPRSVKEILEFMIRKAKVPINFRIEKNLFRPSDIPSFIGSALKIKQAVSWQIKKEFFSSLTETLEWWRMQSVL